MERFDENVESVRAYNGYNRCADWRKLAFTSICMQKTVKYRQAFANMHAHARIWGCLLIIK